MLMTLKFNPKPVQKSLAPSPIDISGAHSRPGKFYCCQHRQSRYYPQTRSSATAESTSQYEDEIWVTLSSLFGKSKEEYFASCECAHFFLGVRGLYDPRPSILWVAQCQQLRHKGIIEYVLDNSTHTLGFLQLPPVTSRKSIPDSTSIPIWTNVSFKLACLWSAELSLTPIQIFPGTTFRHCFSMVQD